MDSVKSVNLFFCGNFFFEKEEEATGLHEAWKRYIALDVDTTPVKDLDAAYNAILYFTERADAVIGNYHRDVCNRPSQRLIDRLNILVKNEIVKELKTK